MHAKHVEYYKISQQKNKDVKELKLCNCRVNSECSLNIECQATDIICKCTVLSPDKPNKVNLGTAEGDFKKRFYKNQNSCNNETSENNTALSKYTRELKETSNLNPNLVWSIANPVPWRRGVVVITTAQLYSTKPEIRFCPGSNPARGLSEIRDGEDLWQWSRVEIRLDAFPRSTIPQNQFIIFIFIINALSKYIQEVSTVLSRKTRDK